MKELTYVLIFLPFVASLICLLKISSQVRSFMVLTTGCILIVSSLLLIPYVPFAFTPQPLFGLGVHDFIRVPDFILMFAILYFGFKHRSLLIIVSAVLQIVLVIWFEAKISYDLQCQKKIK